MELTIITWISIYEDHDTDLIKPWIAMRGDDAMRASWNQQLLLASIPSQVLTKALPMDGTMRMGS